MRGFVTILLSLVLFLCTTGCSNEETDFVARKAAGIPSTDEGADSSGAVSGSYQGVTTTLSNPWENRTCPSLNETGAVGATTISVDYDRQTAGITFPENTTIPGFNAAFQEGEKDFSHFGRGFRFVITSVDDYGDFIPPAGSGCTYIDEAGILVDAIRSEDFQTLDSATYRLYSVCEETDADGNNITATLCTGSITGTLL